MSGLRKRQGAAGGSAALARNYPLNHPEAESDPNTDLSFPEVQFKKQRMFEGRGPPSVGAPALQRSQSSPFW
jgi:hypothetical protein